MTAIAISRLHFPVTTLGPGRRLGVWLQGCSIRCPGCLSVDTWAAGRGTTTTEEVVNALRPWLSEAEGVTVSGGEPFDQPEALASLLRELRRVSSLDTLVYSGYPFDAVAGWLDENPGLIDVLISEPYDERAAQTLALRGSDNQRLHLLTELGRARFAAFERPARRDERRFDIMFDPDGTVWLAGIPARDDLRRLREALNADGHEVVFSEARPGEAAP
ncbi:MAG TPA: 4Fe-4S single cluster domain-containing protein [Pyrinomonadaceae bacterium]|nr:4Fe-4S single cluster domain-containing protein [Pyrinomonadaceae bacterium]